MSPQQHDTEPVRELARLLTPVQQRLHHARVLGRIPAALERALLGIVVAAAVLAGTRLLGVVAGWNIPLAAPGVILLLALAALVPAVVTLIVAWRQNPTLRETAERLDLAAGEHNRVAIALDLSSVQLPAAFASAAVADGVTCLRRIAGANPYSEVERPRWRRCAVLCSACAALLLVTALIGLVRPPSAVPKSAVADSGKPDTARSPHRAADATRRPDDRPARPSPPPRVADSREANQALMASAAQTAMRTEPAAGQPGAGSTSSVRSADGSAAAAGEASSTASKSPAAQREQRRSSNKTGRESAPQRQDRLAGNAQAEQSSAVSFGSSGRGAATPVQHDWALHSQTTAAGDEDDADDEKIEDEREASVQRGGVQPSLKDRNQAPSRDLGLSGDQGPPGTGRGGPTPPKKSRGTASLVLGVPIPDFVRGRLGPGTTKVTHERVTPSAIPADPAPGLEPAPRSRPEAVIRRFEVPAELTGWVRDYLVALHSLDRGAPAARTADDGMPTPVE